jgi:hypothetical protein
MKLMDEFHLPIQIYLCHVGEDQRVLPYKAGKPIEYW